MAEIFFLKLVPIFFASISRKNDNDRAKIEKKG